MKTWKRIHDNPGLWERYFVREKVIRRIRSFFEKEKFHEIETPILIAHPPAESYLDVFETTLLDRHRHPTKAYLSTSPEIPLKKLMAAGLGNCYAITKSFRNMETQSVTHNPEFTILEWYRADAQYTDIMRDCERLLQSFGKTITYQGNTINLSSPWERLTVAESFQKYAHVNFDTFLAHAPEIAKKKGYTLEKNTTWEELFNQIFLNEIERHLGQERPTIIYEFPSAIAALSKHKASDPRFCERFEFYIAGLELGDAYSELTDPVEQEARFKKELDELKRLGKTTYDYDHDFIEALKAGLPKCSGIAVGIDRLVMLLADVTDIADTLFFPASEEFPLSE
jgi:elongation factor P--(R)-beta-lysine ligase